MLWYLEKKEINPKCNSSNKEIHTLVSGNHVLKTMDLSKIYRPNLKKQKKVP